MNRSAHALGAYVTSAAALVAPLALYAALRLTADPEIEVPYHHFVFVGGISLAAALFAGTMAWVARRSRNLQVTLVALAFFSLAAVFGVHGLATPGVLLGPNDVVGIAVNVSIFLAAAFLALASLPPDLPWLRWLGSHQRLMVAVWAAVLVVFGISALRAPSVWGHVMPGSDYAMAEGEFEWDFLLEAPGAVSIPALVIGSVAFWRFMAAYRYARLPLQLALALASMWIVVAQLIADTAPIWHLSWWLYHALLALAVLAMLYGLWRHRSGVRALLPALEATFHADPLQQLEHGLSPGLASLVTATEVRDPYTAGHGLRVARLAVRLGQEMGLSPEALRALAQGGWIHDVGKIGVPDAILNKPGPLDNDERAQVQAHPEAGHRIARNLGTLADELDAIRYHHERWDGKGYPEGRRGPAIPLLARILAVADVYDAMTTKRAYRDAWPEERVLDMIRSDAGSQFDPACVTALERVLGQVPSVSAPGVEVSYGHRPPAARPRSVTGSV